jgi:uncharacterized membrane protein
VFFRKSIKGLQHFKGNVKKLIKHLQQIKLHYKVSS